MATARTRGGYGNNYVGLHRLAVRSVWTVERGERRVGIGAIDRVQWVLGIDFVDRIEGVVRVDAVDLVEEILEINRDDWIQRSVRTILIDRIADIVVALVFIVQPESANAAVTEKCSGRIRTKNSSQGESPKELGSA